MCFAIKQEKEDYRLRNQEKRTPLEYVNEMII